MITSPQKSGRISSSLRPSLGPLDADVASTLITAAADIAVAMDPDGVVVDIASVTIRACRFKQSRADRKAVDRHGHR